MECYRIEKLEFENTLFTTFTDTFLITMEESLRRKEYMYELQKWRPTKNVYIIHNKGFRHCAKNNVQNSAQDLWHANKEIFKLASDIESPILILEDDVKFTQNIFNHATEIENFIVKNNIDAYNLGCTPIINSVIPKHKKHHRVYLMAASHAIVYSHSARQKLKNVNFAKVHDTEVSLHLKVYTFHKCCAIQAFPKTQNFKSWPLVGRMYMNLWQNCSNVSEDGTVFFNFHYSLLKFGGIIPIMMIIIITIITLCLKSYGKRY